MKSEHASACAGRRSDPRQRPAGWPIAVTMLLNAGSILSVQAGGIGVSVPVIGGAAGDLRRGVPPAAPYASGVANRGRRGDGTMNLHLGWVAIATVANVAAALSAAGVDGLGLGQEAWPCS